MDFKTFIFLSKYSLAKKKAFSIYKNSIENDTLSKEQLEDINWSRSKRLIRY